MARRCARARRRCRRSTAAAIVSIEGLSPDQSHPVQRAWIAGNVAQCGYCQVGQIMQAVGAPRREAASDRCRHRCGHGRQHLPLRNLSTHSRGHQDARRRDGHDSHATVPTRSSRRTSAAGTFSAASSRPAPSWSPSPLRAGVPARADRRSVPHAGRRARRSIRASTSASIPTAPSTS